MSVIQNLYTFHHIIQIPALVFQRSSNILSSQEIKENVKKSSSIDYENILYITVIGS